MEGIRCFDGEQDGVVAGQSQKPYFFGSFELCRSSGITLISFAPHTPHRCQPPGSDSLWTSEESIPQALLRLDGMQCWPADTV